MTYNMTAIEVDEFIGDRTRPENTVHYGKKKRFEKAAEQYKMQAVEKSQIILWTNEFIRACGLEVADIDNQIYTKDTPFKEFNRCAKERYALTSEKDIIWMKFAKTGHLGVVACSNDVNFQKPLDKECYDKRHGRKWIYNTSGILLDYLDCDWDEDSFLAFPLKGLEEGNAGKKRRHEIETGVGNYLIAKGVPILDYYSIRI